MKKKIQNTQILAVIFILLISVFIDCVNPIIVYGAQARAIPNTEITITDKQLDSKLNKTQQWINSVSDSVEKSGLTFLNAEQTSKGELKLTTFKNLNDNFSAVTTVTFASNNKDAEFQVVILKDSRKLAVQKMRGQIEKKDKEVFFRYLDSKTKKENTINLTSGHSSAVASIPLAFELISGASELAGITTAMTAALPAAIIVGGAAIIIGGGYYLYTKSTTAKSYPNASISRATVAKQELTSLSSLYKTNIQMNNVTQATQNLSLIKGYSKALNINIESINININPIKININPIYINMETINIPSINIDPINIDLTDFNKIMSDFNESIDSFNKSMKETSEYLKKMNIEIAKNMEYLEDYFRFSAAPSFSSATYDKNAKILNLAGNMPTESTIYIYINNKLSQTSETNIKGDFSLTVNVENAEVAIDAIQKPIGGKNYKSCSSIGLIGCPTFKIHEDGDLTVSSKTNKYVKSPLLVEQYTASPTFDRVTYDSKTKTLNLVGSMPSASTLDIYIGYKKVQTVVTDNKGNFNINIKAKNTNVAVNAIQKSTSKFKYISSRFSGIIGYPTFKIASDGIVTTTAQTNKLLRHPLQEAAHTASPTFDRVTYDSKTKTLNLVGSMPSASNLDIYIDDKKIRTDKTNVNGHFDIKIKVEDATVSIDAVQNSTEKFKYSSFGFAGAVKFYIASDGGVIASENAKLANGVPIKLEKSTPPPVVDEISYNKNSDLLTIPITMAVDSQFTIYRNNIKVQTVDCEAKKTSLITIPLEKGDNNIKIIISGKNTIMTIYPQKSNKTLDFSIDNSRTLKASVFTNFYLKKSLPTVPIPHLSTVPNFSNISFDAKTNTFTISGKMLWKSTITPYLNSEKLQSISTDNSGNFRLSIPVKRTSNGIANIAIDGILDEMNAVKYSSYMVGIDLSMFRVDASGNISVSDFIKKSITPKQVITPIPNVNPIPVGKGVTVQGKALPNSDVIVKNRGVDYGGKANDKGIFSIPVPEILVNDVVEIFVKAPSTAVISYTTSEAVSVQAQLSSSEATVNKDTPKTNESETTSDINDTVYTPEQMGVRAAQEFAAAVVVENGMLTEESIEQLARLAEINAAANVVTLGSYVANSTSSYDQTAYRAGNTFYTMGSAGWDAIMDELIKNGIVDNVKQNEEMWKINQKFLDNQIVKGKIFEFTVNPTTIPRKKYGYQEFEYLQNNGYHLVELNERFKMVK